MHVQSANNYSVGIETRDIICATNVGVHVSAV